MNRVGVLALVLVALSCSRTAPPPWGLEQFPEQHYRFETDEITTIDGTPVSILRMAEVVLRAKPQSDSSNVQLELYVERYFMRVQGGPGGTSEMSVSEEGLTAATAEGPVSLKPNEKTPGGDTVNELRARPIASAVLDRSGATTAGLWTSPHPVWAGVSLLDWLLLALPTRPAAKGDWTVNRAVPQIGQYTLGFDLPVRWEEQGGPATLHGESRVTRDQISLAPNFQGKASVQSTGEANLLPDGRVRDANVDLVLKFAATNGTHVSSSHRIRLHCTSCDGPEQAAPVNSSGERSDSQEGSDGTSKQGHVDDLPDHGGVRRGL